MKRYWLFAGSCYYDGGARDFKGAFDSVEAAKQAHAEWLPKDKGSYWGHVVDVTEDGPVVVQQLHTEWCWSQDKREPVEWKEAGR